MENKVVSYEGSLGGVNRCLRGNKLVKRMGRYCGSVESGTLEVKQVRSMLGVKKKEIRGGEKRVKQEVEMENENGILEINQVNRNQRYDVGSNSCFIETRRHNE